MSFEERVFADAMALPPSEWPAFVRRACGDNAEFCARVEALLREHTLQRATIDLPSSAAGSGVGRVLPSAAPPNEEPSQRIGLYQLLRKIGEGGFGVVWLAEQQEPVKREVALKIIRAGMDTKEVISRFAMERQALALMDHPNIAKVLDAGATESGRPYFVMELVRGITITTYCDEQNLPTRARLELFTQVCHAVQHAHQKGIIHRDIKPSNILVAQHDGAAVPKVIDFGIAKATAGRLTDHTLFTKFEQFMGTPAYMSPEQAALTNLDIDTRSDIYSLGVLLYELLTGRTPFDSKSLLSAGLDEMRRVIREVDPPRPSTRVNTMSELDRAVTAKQRCTMPAELTGRLRGDLDAIVMKGLEKNRDRRYETANAMALDILRHLHDEPILARQPSAAYRFRKLAHRHRFAFMAAAAVALALIAGTVVSTFQAVRANQAEKSARSEADRANAAGEIARNEARRANSAEQAARNEAERASTSERQARTEAARANNAEKNARSEAERANGAEKTARTEADRATAAEAATRSEAAIAKAVNDFLTFDLLRQTDSRAQASARLEPNPNLTMREALDRAAEKVGTRFQRQPLTEAAIRTAIGSAYFGLGEAAKSSLHHEQATQLLTRTLGREHHDTLASMNSLGNAYNAQSRHATAVALLTETVEIQKRVLGPEHRDTLASINNLANAYAGQGKYAQALTLHEQKLETSQRVLGAEHPDTLNSMHNVAFAHHAQGRYARAAAVLNQMLPIQKRVLGEEHPSTIHSMNTLGLAYDAEGKFAEAAAVHRDVLEVRKRVLGAEHLETLGSMNNLAMAYSSARKFDEAALLHAKTLELMKRVLGPENSYTLNSMHNLANTYRAQGRFAESEALHTQTLEIRKRVLGAEHPDTFASMISLANAYQSQGRLADAARLQAEAVAKTTRVMGDEHPQTLRSMLNLARVYRAQGKLREAAELAAQSLAGRKRVLSNDHGDTLGTLHELVGIYEELNDLPNGEVVCRELLAGRLRKEAADSTVVAFARTMLGANLLAQQKFEDAGVVLQSSLKVREQKMPNSWHTFYTRSLLGGSLAGRKKFAEAEPFLVSGHEGMKQRWSGQLDPEKTHFKASLERLVRLYTDWGKRDKAAAWQLKLTEHARAKAQ